MSADRLLMRDKRKADEDRYFLDANADQFIGWLKQIAPIMVFAAGLPGIAMIICLVANRGYSKW